MLGHLRHGRNAFFCSSGGPVGTEAWPQLNSPGTKRGFSRSHAVNARIFLEEKRARRIFPAEIEKTALRSNPEIS